MHCYAKKKNFIHSFISLIGSKYFNLCKPLVMTIWWKSGGFKYKTRQTQAVLNEISF